MASCTIAISRSAEALADRSRFEEALIQCLRSGCGLHVVVTPSIYWLTPSSSALAALRRISGNIALASWLHPRAACWVLRAHRVEGACRGDENKPQGGTGSDPHERIVRCFNLDNFDSPEACAEALRDAAGVSDEETTQAHIETIDEEVSSRWYPVLDESRCINCKQCHDFCLFGVYELDERDRVRVSNPDACKPGCPACARICPVRAIMFPHHVDDPVIAGAPDVEPVEEHAGTGDDGTPRDELDDLIDALDELDV